LPHAVCLVRNKPPYPHSQFAEGLAALGFKVSDNMGHRPKPGDVLLIWNRNGPRHPLAGSWERAGAKVVVAENGWIAGRGKFYAVCLGHHNGAGTWRVGETDRWPLMGVEIKPWRERGDRIVILASRGIGEPGIAQPHDWPRQIVHSLKKRTRRPVVLRPHPGDSHARIEDAMAGAHAVVTWASGAAVKAIALGIPAFHAMPKWIGAGAARPIEHDLEDPFLGDRFPMFRRLAWAQWTDSEIRSGEALRHLCG
jgi:hypothetical protein